MRTMHRIPEGHAVSARPWWSIVQAWVHNRHECPGLGPCTKHPKWSVIVGRTDEWVVFAPFGTVNVATFPTWAEAYEYAQQQARKDTP